MFSHTVGKHSYGNPCISWRQANLTIGNFCSIGGNVNIYLGGNHRIDWVSTISIWSYSSKHI